MGYDNYNQVKYWTRPINKVIFLSHILRYLGAQYIYQAQFIVKQSPKYKLKFFVNEFIFSANEVQF